MRLPGVIIGGSSVLAVVGALMLVPTAAQAQAVSGRARATAPAISLTEAQRAQQGERGLQWNENGRWGLNLNLQQPVGRDAEWRDVQAGAYYRINPRLAVGASAAVSNPRGDPSRMAEPGRGQPRVRLETIFRF